MKNNEQEWLRGLPDAFNNFRDGRGIDILGAKIDVYWVASSVAALD